MDAVEPYYLSLLPAIRETAKQCGYAVGVHGSLRRDFDLIAAPWVEDAKPAVELAEAIRAAVNGRIQQSYRLGDPTPRNPSKKPCGRIAWAIMLNDVGFVEAIDGVPYIDLSVMPKGSA